MGWAWLADELTIADIHACAYQFASCTSQWSVASPARRRATAAAGLMATWLPQRRGAQNNNPPLLLLNIHHSSAQHSCSPARYLHTANMQCILIPASCPNTAIATFDHLQIMSHAQAVLAAGRLYVAGASLVAADPASPSYSRRPAVAWAELALQPSLVGSGPACPQSRAGGNARAVWDWSLDYSRDWGAEASALLYCS